MLTTNAYAMKQIVFSGSQNPLNPSATEYNYIHTRSAPTWNATESNRIMMCPGTGTLHSLQVKMSAAPGSDGTYTFTIRKNQAATSLAAAVIHPATTGSDFANEISISAGDEISIEVVPTNGPGPATPFAAWTFIYQDDDEDEFVLFAGDTDSNMGNTAIISNTMQGGANWTAAVPVRTLAFNVLSALDGDFKNLYIEIGAAPGAFSSWTFEPRVEGSTGTLQVVISGASATTGNDTANTDSVSASDKFDIRNTPSRTAPVNTWAIWGSVFQSDDPYSHIITGGSSNALHNTNTEYNFLATFGTAWNATETNRRNAGQPSVLSNLYVEGGGSPGAGNSYAFTVMKNGAATGLTCTMSGTGTTCSDTDKSHSVEVDDLDTFSLRVVPTSTPSTIGVAWGLAVRDIAPFPQSMGQMGMGI